MTSIVTPTLSLYLGYWCRSFGFGKKDCDQYTFALELISTFWPGIKSWYKLELHSQSMRKPIGRVMICSEAPPGSQVTLGKRAEAAQYFFTYPLSLEVSIRRTEALNREPFGVCILPPSSAFDSELSELVGSPDG